MLLCALHSRLACADLASETDFHIDAQPLAAALTAFADATHIQLVMAAEDLGDRRSPGFHGRATAVKALTALLRGTSLHFQIISADTVAILAGEAPPPAPTPAPPLLDDVLIVGRGHTHASNTLRPREAPAKALGAAVQTLLSDLPGVNVQASDPYGLYEFADSVRIRGFASNQLGIALDGVPLESYDVRDGTPPGRYIDAEDLAEATVTQGSGDVTMPSYHALGGSVRYLTPAPTGQWGAQLSSTIGAHDLRRVHARVDTPAWWPDGPSAQILAARTRATQFDNPEADMAVDHAAFKLAGTLGPVEALLTWRYGDRDDHDMQTYDAQGHVSPTFDLLEEPTGDPARDALYYDYWTNGRSDRLLSVQLRTALGAGWSAQLLPYYEHKRGYGYAGVSPDAAQAQYAASIDPETGSAGRSDNQPYDGSGIAQRKELLHGRRGGATLALTRERARGTLSLGGWYEHYDFTQSRSLYNTDDGGHIDDDAAPIVTYYDRDFRTQVAQFYGRHSSRWFDERLRLDLGFKGLYVDRRFAGIPNLAAYNRRQQADIGRIDRDLFQPQLGLRYTQPAVVELFASYAENFSAAPRDALGAETYDPQLEPETSRNIDLGLRRLGERFNASATLYSIDYENRILVLTVADPFTLTRQVYRNVGEVRTRGLELAAYWKPLDSLRLGSTLTLNRSTFAGDYQRYDPETGSEQTIAVDGKTLPDAPRVMAGLWAQYRVQRLSLELDGRYLSRRYSTAVNDESVPEYAVVDAALGYELAGRASRLGSLRLQLQVYNLFDERYNGYISPAEYLDNDNRGSFGLGTPRSLYLSLSAERS